MSIKLLIPTSLLVSVTTFAIFSSGIPAQATTTNLNAVNKKDTEILTSAAVLKSEPSVAVVAQVEPITPDTVPPATTPTEPTPGVVEPGRTTRGGSSYVGAAGNIGLTGGETALGIGNFTVISKIGLTEAVSARPAVVIGDDTTILIPVTYDFILQPTGAATEVVSNFAPYVGGGLAIATGDNSDVGPLVTAGVDVPLGAQFTATAGVNVGFFDSTSVGLLIGVGYNFQGL